MIVSRKILLSLLISLLLFAGFTALAFTGLFDLVETRFYDPAITRAIAREIKGDAKTIEAYLQELQTRFAVTLQEGSIRRSFFSSQGSGNERSKRYGALQDSLAGLQYIRFIDSDGHRIHYSSYAPDTLQESSDYIAYRQYDETSGYIPYGQIEVPEGGEGRLLLDESGERIIFSFPFYDSFEVYRGTAVFSLAVRAIMEQMVSAGRIKVGEDISIISRPPGLVLGLPYTGKSTLIPLIASVWNDGILSLSALGSGFTETRFFLVSAKTSQGIFVGRLVNGALLSFPQSMKIILLASFFLTVYLIIFLLFNLRQDNLTILHNRLKQLQLSLIAEYYGHKEEADWDRWKGDLELRREDVRSELTRGIKTNPAGAREIDAFIDRSWDELVALIGGRLERKPGSGMDDEKLQALLSHLFSTMQNSVPGSPQNTPAGAEKRDEQEEAEAVEEQEARENIEHESLPTVDFEEVSLETFETRGAEEELGTLEEILDEPEGALAAQPRAVPEFQELDPLELGIPDELEKEHESEANTMAENFEIVSPFSTILSGFPGEHALKEEQLELLDEEPVPEDTRETLAEELGVSFAGSLLYHPFQTEMADEVEVLESPDDGDAEEALPDLEIPPDSGEEEFILERDGVSYINENLLSPNEEILEKLDQDFQGLIDSVLNK